MMRLGVFINHPFNHAVRHESEAHPFRIVWLFANREDAYKQVEHGSEQHRRYWRPSRFA
jgi:hypothetical protein